MGIGLESTTKVALVGSALLARRNSEIRTTTGLVSVFRYSLLFSFCMMLVIWLALLIIFLVLQAAGVIDTVAQWIGCLVKPDQGTYRCTPAIIDGARIFTWLFFAGCVFALVWTALTVFIALLYNLISDIVGGVEVTLSERHRG